MITNLKNLSTSLKKIAEVQGKEVINNVVDNKFVKVASDKVLDFIKFFGTLEGK